MLHSQLFAKNVTIYAFFSGEFKKMGIFDVGQIPRLVTTCQKSKTKGSISESEKKISKERKYSYTSLYLLFTLRLLPKFCKLV